MNRSIVFVFSTLLSITPGIARAADLTPDEQAFFDRHTSDLVRFETQRLDDPAVAKVFSAPFYTVKFVLKDGDSEQSSELRVVRIEDKLVPVGQPSSDDAQTGFLKLLNPAFKLRTEADGKLLQQALDAAYPINSESDKKAKAMRHKGRTWTFVRGEFFDSKLGYIFETEAGGAIKSVKFVLKLP